MKHLELQKRPEVGLLKKEPPKQTRACLNPTCQAQTTTISEENKTLACVGESLKGNKCFFVLHFAYVMFQQKVNHVLVFVQTHCNWHRSLCGRLCMSLKLDHIYHTPSGHKVNSRFFTWDQQCLMVGHKNLLASNSPLLDTPAACTHFALCISAVGWYSRMCSL